MSGPIGQQSAPKSPLGWRKVRSPTRNFSLLFVFTSVVLALTLAFQRYASAQAPQVTYGGNGVQTLSYRGVILEDSTQFSSDDFHIWHMRMTDLNGNLLTGGQYSWGETNSGKSWNLATQTWTYTFSWGSVQSQFIQRGNELAIKVVESNNANSGVILDGLSIFPLALHFPVLPKGFVNASYPQLGDNKTSPTAISADYGSGLVANVVARAGALYTGLMPTALPNVYSVLISSTTPDGLAPFETQLTRHVMPGSSDTFTLSLRFAPSGTPIATLAADAYQSWAATWPPILNWKDHRIIGTAYLASSPVGNPATPGGYPNNPRRYFNDNQASDFDVTTPDGLVRFQQKVLAQAVTDIQNLQMLNAQGMITWDIEGEQYPQNTSYVCSPDQIAKAAPEMESVIRNDRSPYFGMKLDDAYFRIITDAGFRVGVCVRPQTFVLNRDGTAAQLYGSDTAAILATLIGKMKYAHDRWGATLFYLDSTVDGNGATLDALLFQQAAAALPDSLLIPEESTPKHYAYTSPFKDFLFSGQTGTDPTVYQYYPNAFSTVLVNDADAVKLQGAEQQLIQAVLHGDILMVHADYWQANNPVVVQIYAAAGLQK